MDNGIGFQSLLGLCEAELEAIQDTQLHSAEGDRSAQGGFSTI